MPDQEDMKIEAYGTFTPPPEAPETDEAEDAIASDEEE
jgi:hypothetical protein